MKNAVFWDVALCRSCVNRRFGGTSVHTRSTQPRIPEDGFLLKKNTVLHFLASEHLRNTHLALSFPKHGRQISLCISLTNPLCLQISTSIHPTPSLSLLVHPYTCSSLPHTCFASLESLGEIFRTSSEINCLSVSFRRSLVIVPFCWCFFLLILPNVRSELLL
jgi:hypothetical protein